MSNIIHSKDKTREDWIREAIEALELCGEAAGNFQYSFAIFTSIIKDKLK